MIACPECLSQTPSIRLYTVAGLKPCRNEFHEGREAEQSGRRATIKSAPHRTGRVVTGVKAA